MLKIGDPAPSFTAKDQNGTIHTLADYAGQYLLLYFYPRDNTPGCTIEACNFRDHYDVITASHITIVGVSKDSPGSHGRFADRFALPFTLLSDPNKEIMRAYDTLTEKTFIGKKYLGTDRVSYLIDPQGKVAQVFPNVNPLTHIQEILQTAATIKP